MCLGGHEDLMVYVFIVFYMYIIAYLGAFTDRTSFLMSNMGFVLVFHTAKPDSYKDATRHSSSRTRLNICSS